MVDLTPRLSWFPCWPRLHRLCLAAGVNISGINGEVLPSQWEYQVSSLSRVGEVVERGLHAWPVCKPCALGEVLPSQWEYQVRSSPRVRV